MDDYELIRNIARLFLQKVRQEKSLHLEDIREQVGKACQSPGIGSLNSVEKEKLVKELEAQYQTVIGTERELLGEDEGWEHWLTVRRGQITWKYWDRYKSFLLQQDYPEDVVSRLDSSTDRVLGLLGDPKREESWDRRGLVVGLVQSGKTAHYVGTINKAVDAGYSLIIVLTGFTESLRIQTQKRIDEGVIGFSVEPDPDKPNGIHKVYRGVHHHNPFDDTVVSVTSCQDDFKLRNFKIPGGHIPFVFVVKKNFGVLRHLLNWASNVVAKKDDVGNPHAKGIPLLVIDDESDVGSVDTKKGVVDSFGNPDPDHDPSRINGQIRKLLSLFNQTSYVGYTATPFANVLIHDQGKVDTDPEDGLVVGEDLYPRSFIVSLPTPSNHVGPTTVFGSNLDGENATEGLPIIREIEDTELGTEPTDCWMPTSHGRNHVPVYLGSEQIPPSLREAMLSFILVIAARRLRGDTDKHNSMLVHVTLFNDVQNLVFEQVEHERQRIVDRLRNRTGDLDLLDNFRKLWEEGQDSFLHTTSELQKRQGSLFHNPTHSWSSIFEELYNAAASIEVGLINGAKGDLPNYEDSKHAINLISIGGNKLARGLTLPGLSVSYFLRCSKMYDTLMQMGRWFGYRDGYLDLCRLYTTQELSEWFSHIADATEELRGEFDQMANLGKTPKEYGLRVATHPQMRVTSALKMQAGEVRNVCFRETLIQTTDFSRKENVLANNWNSALTLIDKVERLGIDLIEPRKNAAMWAGVPFGLVTDFLEQYQEHQASHTRTRELCDYIEKRTLKGDLTEWTVLLSGGKLSQLRARLGSAEVNLCFREWKNYKDLSKQDADHLKTGALRGSADELVDLDEFELEKALKLDIQDWERSNGIRKGKLVQKPKKAGGRFARMVRKSSKGLLILYPIAQDIERSVNGEHHILGFAISFPASSGKDNGVSYVVGNVYQKQEISRNA